MNLDRELVLPTGKRTVVGFCETFETVNRKLSCHQGCPSCVLWSVVPRKRAPRVSHHKSLEPHSLFVFRIPNLDLDYAILDCMPRRGAPPRRPRRTKFL